MMSQLKSRFQAQYIFWILALIGVIGAIIMWISTPWGIGVGYDSVFYLSAADNLINGLGLSRLDGYGNIIPLTHFPPLYPLILAAFSFATKVPTDIIARWISVLLFGINIFLIGWLVHRYTRSTLPGVLASMAALASPILVDVHLMAMTEPLYLVLMLLTLHCLQCYLDPEQSSHWIWAAILAGLAYLTRYVGITLVAVGGILILLRGRRLFLQRVKDAFLFGVVSVLPIAGWYFRNAQTAGTLSNRVLVYHPPTVEKIIGGISTISQWFFPGVVSGTLRTMGLAIISIVFLIFGTIWLIYLRKNLGDENSASGRFAGSLGLYLIVYLAMLGASLTLFDASTRLNDRILSPVFVLLILIFVITIWQAVETIPGRKVLGWSFVTVFLVWIGASALGTYQVFGLMNSEGRGFASRTWRESETLSAVQELPADSFMFSNEAFLIYHWTKNSVNWIPEMRDFLRSNPVPDYDLKLAKMQQDILQFNGYLVVFDTIEKHWVYPSLEEMSAGLDLYSDFADGVIYTSP